MRDHAELHLVPDSVKSTLDWASIEAGPSIEPDQVLFASAPVSAFSEDQWSLEPLGIRYSINWVRPATSGGRSVRDWPGAYIAPFKRAMWLMINRSVPDRLLSVSSPRRDKLSPNTLRDVGNMWKRFAAWLINQGIDTLDGVTSDILYLYALDLRDSNLSPAVAATHSRRLIDLWARAEWLPPSDRIDEPPFQEDGLLTTNAVHQTENATVMIQPSTMAPLLAWALLLVEELSVDILGAFAEYRRLTALMEAEGLNIPRSHKTMTEAIAAIADRQEVGPLPPRFVNIQGRIADRPWCSSIEWCDVPRLVSVLRTACLVLGTYLTGMRPKEVLNLRPDCIEQVADENGAIRYLVNGRRWKGIQTEEKVQNIDGVEEAWITVKPGADALVLAQDLAISSDYLFQAPRTGAPMDPQHATKQITALIRWTNAHVEALALPENLHIPACPGGKITLNRFRRTLAWHIRHQPNGHVALAVQYKHMTVEQGEGYAGAKHSGLAAVLDEETRSAAMSATAALRDEVAAGGGLSGLGADRALGLAKRSPVGYLSGREEKRLLANRDRVVFDNPSAFALCLNDPDKALCLRGGGPKSSTPKTTRCAGMSCPNIVFTDSGIERKRAESVRLREEAKFLPHPSAVRLEEKAERLEAEADQHYLHRKALPPEQTVLEILPVDQGGDEPV